MSQVEKMDKSNIEDILPLTPMQESMLFQYISHPDTGQYFEQLSLKLEGKIDTALFKEAWQMVAGINEMLRAVYRWDKLEQPVQIIRKSVEIPVQEYDCDGWEEQRKNAMLEVIKANDRKAGIDIRTAPFRVILCKLADDNYEMIISNHHILFDGWSNGILLHEFMETYQRLTDGAKPVLPAKTKFKEFVKWLRDQDKSKQKVYWTEYLQEFKTRTVLPYDRKRQSDAFSAQEYSCFPSSELATRINDYARRKNLSAAVIFYAAWSILLQKYGNPADIVFGTTVAGRPHQLNGIQDMAGLFINTLPLRIKFDPQTPINSLFETINVNLNGREDYEAASLSDIKLYSELGGNENLFDSIMAVENYPLSERLAAGDRGLRVKGYSAFERTNFDLTVAVMAFSQVEIKLIYNCDRFQPETITGLARHLLAILDAITAQPEARPVDIQILSAEERDELLTGYNRTATNFPKFQTLQALFEEQAAQLPEQTALVFETRRISYAELNRKANQLAAFLREKGVGANTSAGLIVDRSPEMIVAIFGILKAGGAYLPLDHEFPRERTMGIINDSNPVLLIVQEDLITKMGDTVAGLKAGLHTEVITLSEALAALEKYPAENLKPVNQFGDTAYIMYTSGSTGIPKGILTKHHNISRVVKDTNYIQITDNDVLLQLSNYAFDGSTFDIFGALLNGATLVQAKKETVLDVYRLAELIRQEKVSVFFITTALFNTLVDLDVGCLQDVRKVLFGGERVSVPHVKKALQTVGPDKIVHVYGPTETTVYATYYPIHSVDEDLGTIPIGKPISNTGVYILDNDLRLLPKGAPGELYIGGDGLANGYLKRPELTAERFVANPFSSKELIYKTGDQVKWLHDGNIVFLDRLDNQVKLRGFRIELGEIETALLSHGQIREAVVLAKDDKAGNKYLCAYLVAGGEISPTTIREHLLQNLPDYMVPSRMVFLDEMPLTSNGKVNQKALWQYDDSAGVKGDYEAPSGGLETGLAVIWRELLGVADIGVNDNFFDLGGHSLKATVLVAQIHKKLNIEIPLGEIFKNPTIKGLAHYLANSERRTLPPIPPAPISESYKVSSAQKRMYVQHFFEGIGASYNMPIALMINGKLDREKLSAALQEVVNRHEPFRTSFCMADGEIRQRVHPKVELTVEYSEIPEKPSGAESSPERIIKDFIRPFDLNNAPLMRIKLLKLSDTRHILVMDMHHIIADGISLVVLIKELSGLYEGNSPAPLEIQYKDFAVWQNEYFQSVAFQKLEQYWRETFAGEIPLLNMPIDYHRPEQRKFQGRSFKFTISAELATGLNQMARERGITPNALLIAVYAVMLNRYSGQNDIIIGSLVAGRLHPDVQNMIGMFNNFLPIRLDIDPKSYFNVFLQSSSQRIMRAYENQDYPYDKLIENVTAAVDKSRNPLFDTMLILHNELESLDNISFGALSARNYPIEHETSKLDFKLDIYPGSRDGELQCILEYSVDLFRTATMERMAGHWLNIIGQVLENPAIRLADIDIISAPERDEILNVFNDTGADYPKDRTIYRLFEEQAQKTPDNTAVIYEDQKLTYAELNRKANQLARLLRETGLKPDRIAGILMERSLEMIIGIMAVLKAGGAYLPISPDYPAERIKYMLEDSNAAVLLTHDRFREKARFDRPVLLLENQALYSGDATDLEMWNQPTDLAYVIYTSGSTGKPKGVMIEHYSLVNRLNWMQKAYPIGPGDIILQKTPYTFDVSVWELFWWSMVGAGVCFLKPGGEKEPETIAAAIIAHRVTTMHFVPSMLTAFLVYIENRKNPEQLRSLRQVFSSGEALNPGQVAKFNRLLFEPNGTKLHNLYGPTEATVDVSYFDCSTGEELTTIPIGRPIDNIRLYVLNETNKIQPVGVPGELHIAGDGLARGYLNRNVLTGEKFVADPFFPGTRMYRTGDLTRWLPDGNIEYLGRIDNQVKVRGFRVELGEIEAELLKHGDVHEVVVSAREDRDGTKYLCAYFVSERELPVAEFRAYLSQNLPDTMIPSYFIRLDKIPLTPNGKVNRSALPAPEGDINTGRVYVAPSNPVEMKLAELWQEILGIDRIGIHDEFSELGGHSLKAADLANKIHQRFNVDLSLQEIFAASTIRKMAERIQAAGAKVFYGIPRVTTRDHYPVSAAQKRIFILNRLEGDNTAYNLPAMVLIEGQLDPVRLQNVLVELVKRHESLRTSFRVIGEEPAQIVHDVSEIEITIENITATEADLPELARKFIRPFALDQAPLIRAALVTINDRKALLMFDLHHIIADGVSAVILVREFVAIYEEAGLTELKVQYKDFAVWQNERLEEEDIKRQERYWLDKFNGMLPVLNMPVDFPRPPVQSNEGDKLWFKLDRDTVGLLRKAAAAQGATLFMAILAVYNILLYRYTQQEDIIAGTPTAGRRHADLEPVIGMFVNTLALRNFPTGAKTFRQFLAEIKTGALEAFENQDYQFEKLVGALDLPRDISRNPLFDTMFALQNMGIPRLELKGLKFLPYPFTNPVAKLDLTLEIIDDPDEPGMNIEYCVRLFKPATIRRLAGHFQQILREVATHSEIRLQDIQMLSAEERRQILYDFNDTRAEYPRHKTIYQLFEDQAAVRPDQVAVIYGNQTLTYTGFNRKVNQLAHVLRSKGVKPDQIVAVMMERSLEMMIGIMAVLKAGGAYLPINPDYPTGRIKYMLADSNAVLLLTHRSFTGKVELALETLCLEDESWYSGDGDHNPETRNHPGDLAYVIYTSGSTGQPKGAMIEHFSLVNRLNWMQKSYPLGQADVILQKTPYTFDVSVWELFWWSISGAGVCFLKPGGEKDPEAIVAAIEANQITTMHFVPSMLTAFLAYLESGVDLERLKSLKRVFASGEALNLQQVTKFNQLLNRWNGTKLFNLYGPTEATVDVSYFDCSTGEELEMIPIGKPIDNIQLYVLDRMNNLQPVGVPGELHIAGDGLARGYLNRPELTVEKFIRNPFQAGTRVYKTGDLCRWLPNGNIEYLGRIDNQVKVRGFRIELGEIEAGLLEHPDIHEAVVTARDDQDGNKQLCAYLVTRREFTVIELREYLGRSLPDYMVPSYFIFLDKMPLSPNGKVNRRELPAPETNMAIGVPYAPPESEVEKRLVSLWQEILERDQIGIHDNFFDLGGNSLLLIRMYTRLAAEYPGRVKVTDLFMHTSVAKIAEFISKAENASKELLFPALAFPPEYFESDTGLRTKLLTFTFDSETFCQVGLLAADAKVTQCDLLLAGYCYLLARISNTQQLTVQTAIGQSGRFLPLAIDLRNINDFRDLMLTIHQSRLNYPDSAAYGPEDLRQAKPVKHTAEIIPFFGEGNCGNAIKIELLDIFDIILEISAEAEGITGNFKYDGRRLKGEKIKEFAELYIKLIKYFLTQSQAAATEVESKKV